MTKIRIKYDQICSNITRYDQIYLFSSNTLCIILWTNLKENISINEGAFFHPQYYYICLGDLCQMKKTQSEIEMNCRG